MDKNNKPELGCRPYWISSAMRVSELAEAINRHSKTINFSYEYIEEWAKEICGHCAIARCLDESKNK